MCCNKFETLILIPVYIIHNHLKPNFSCCGGDADLPNKTEIYVLSFKNSPIFLKDLNIKSCIIEKLLHELLFL
jgi:hypothetical protein